MKNCRRKKLSVNVPLSEYKETECRRMRKYFPTLSNPHEPFRLTEEQIETPIMKRASVATKSIRTNFNPPPPVH